MRKEYNTENIRDFMCVGFAILGGMATLLILTGGLTWLLSQIMK